MESEQSQPITIKSYKDISLDKVTELFGNFNIVKRGGNQVFVARKQNNIYKKSPVRPRHEPNSTYHYNSENRTYSENYHRESSFSFEQIPYIEFLNRALVNIIREHFTQEVMNFIDVIKEESGEKYENKRIIKTAFERALISMLRILCENYPNLNLVIKAFFLKTRGAGVDGLVTALSIGFSGDLLEDLDEQYLDRLFVASHPAEFDKVREYEIMCSGMPVAFEIAKAIDETFLKLGIKGEERYDVGYTIGIHDGDYSLHDDLRKVIEVS